MESNRRKLHIGVIGVGNIGFVHASCIYSGGVPGAVLGAVCDLKAAMEAELQTHFPGVPFYQNYQDLLADPQIDAVIVSVSHPSHSDVAISAFEAGKSFTHIPMECIEIPEKEVAQGHQRILQNFTNSILWGEPLLAPRYDGLNELTIQNAAYLSAWKGSIPVSLPFDENEYDALLANKQTGSHVSLGARPDAKHTAYSERWQINW